MKTSFKITVNSLFNMIVSYFFGCLVWKRFSAEVCFFCLKQRQISIGIYQNHKFLVLFLDFYTTTQKTEIAATTSPKNFMKTSFKSIVNSLFIMICFIFFGCMVWKKFIVEVCFFCLKYRHISIEIYQNHKFLDFLLEFYTATQKTKIAATTSPKKFMKASFKSTVNSLFITQFTKQGGVKHIKF